MIDAVLSPEAARFREQLRNGGMLPPSAPVEAVIAPGRQQNGKHKKNPLIAGRFGDLNAFIDTAMADLTRAEIATWMTLFRFTDVKKNSVTISIEKIAERSGTSVRHTHKAIGTLLEKGLLERLKTGSLNTGASVYRLHPLLTRRSTVAIDP